MRDVALRQAQELAAVSGGAFEVIGSRVVNDWLVVGVSLDTHGITTVGAGITVRRRERFEFYVPKDFPFLPPSVWVAHRRWSSTPHVQWGRYLCLYAETAVEWNPADGLRGLVDRLINWLVHAAADTLDPDGQPLHPPVIYANARAGRLVVHPDVGQLVPWGDSVISGQTRLLYAWCERTGTRVDVREWLTLQAAIDRILGEDFVAID